VRDRLRGAPSRAPVNFYIESYVAATPSLTFGPTTQLEVEGLSGYFEFSAEDITEAPPDTADFNLVYFFNPAKHYGTSPLLDATVATEYCEVGF
jgi:hypothetical protein